VLCEGHKGHRTAIITIIMNGTGRRSNYACVRHSAVEAHPDTIHDMGATLAGRTFGRVPTLMGRLQNLVAIGRQTSKPLAHKM
jgi:hypothetical protein